jgi:hypothetical protein
VETAELGVLERFAPGPGEVRSPELGALRPDEDEALVPRFGVLLQVRPEIAEQHGRNTHNALAGL